MSSLNLSIALRISRSAYARSRSLSRCTLVARQRNGHGGEHHHDGESHDQLHQSQAALSSASHDPNPTAPSPEATERCTEIGCCWELLQRCSRVTLTVLVPLPTAVKVNCISGPEPFTPPPATRLTSMLASPVSLRISRLGAISCHPGVRRRPAGDHLSKRRIFGSHRTLTGTPARSEALSTCSPTTTGAQHQRLHRWRNKRQT